MMPERDDRQALGYLSEVRVLCEGKCPETEIAYARISPNTYIRNAHEVIPEVTPPQVKLLPKWQQKVNWQMIANVAQGIGELSGSSQNKAAAARALRLAYLGIFAEHTPQAVPDILRSYSKFKADDLEAVLRENLASSDVFIRATAAELLAENFP